MTLQRELETVAFKVHLHRQAMADGDPRMWYVHVEGWPEAVAFHDIKMNVPTHCAGSKTSACGCTSHVAQGWIEGRVKPDEVTFSEDGKIVSLGAEPTNG